MYDGEVCDPKYLCGKSVNVTYFTPESEWCVLAFD
jgi:hypothetical protein